MALSARQVAIKHGFRSGLEQTVAAQLTSRGVNFRYEHPDDRINWEVPARTAKYTPDFHLLDSGIIVETKGRFLTADRQKHLQVKRQFPHIDLRFVFSSSRTRISKASKTTYGMWCEKHGFLYADKMIPEEWLNERRT